MLTAGRSQLFGSRTRTRLLILLNLLEESYPRELARLLDAPLFSVQRMVDALEKEGCVATRVIGRERRVSLDPRYIAAEELRALLSRLSLAEPELELAAASLRRRPRRRGKEL